MAGQGVPGFIRMSECLILALVPLTLWLMFTDKLRCLIAGILLLLGTGSLLEMNGGLLWICLFAFGCALINVVCFVRAYARFVRAVIGAMSGVEVEQQEYDELREV